jgi:hypothetical protein
VAFGQNRIEELGARFLFPTHPDICSNNPKRNNEKIKYKNDEIPHE